MRNQCPHPKSLEEKKNLTLPSTTHTHTHTQNPAKRVEDAWQDSFQCPAHFLRQFLITGWEFTNLELFKKSNFVFMYLEFFKRFNLVLKTQFENKDKRIKNCILEEVTCIGFFFFIPNVDKHRTNKQPDPELVYDDSPRKHCGSHTRQLASQLPCPRPPLMERKRRKTEGTSVLRRQPRWAAHVPAGGENAAKNRLYKLPTCLLFRGFVIYTTNQDIIPENLLSNLKGVVRCVSLNKWISFAGRSSRNIVHLPNS